MFQQRLKMERLLLQTVTQHLLTLKAFRELHMIPIEAISMPAASRIPTGRESNAKLMTRIGSLGNHFGAFGSENGYKIPSFEYENCSQEHRCFRGAFGESPSALNVGASHGCKNKQSLTHVTYSGSPEISVRHTLATILSWSRLGIVSQLISTTSGELSFQYCLSLCRTFRTSSSSSFQDYFGYIEP